MCRLGSFLSLDYNDVITIVLSRRYLKVWHTFQAHRTKSLFLTASSFWVCLNCFLYLVDLKQAILATAKRKDEVEEKNRYYFLSQHSSDVLATFKPSLCGMNVRKRHVTVRWYFFSFFVSYVWSLIPFWTSTFKVFVKKRNFTIISEKYFI